jgi:hypothetical protein
MAKTTGKKTGPAFASLNPDDMVQGGLPSDFRGTVIAAAFCKWNYGGSIEGHVLAVRLTIRPHEDSDIKEDVVQHWSAGKLTEWAPSDEEGNKAKEGPYATRVGKKPEMAKNSNLSHLMETILESGQAAKGKPFGPKQLDAAITCLVGLDAEWTRVPQKKRSGMTDSSVGGDEDDDTGDEDDDDKPAKKKNSNRDILVVTEVFGYDPDAAAEMKPKKKKAKAEDEGEEESDEDTDSEEEEEEEAPPPKKKKKPAVEEDEEDEEEEAEADEDEAKESEDEEDEDVNPLDADLSKKVKSIITKAGGSLKKGRLAAALLVAYATDKKKGKYVERAAEESFLASKSRPWTYSAKTSTLSIDDE